MVAVHAGEEHVLLIDILHVIALNLIAVGFFGTSLLLTLIYRSLLFADGNAVVALNLQLYLAGVCLSVEQGTVSILITAQIGSQGKDILGRVLIHRCVGRAADYDYGV